MNKRPVFNTEANFHQYPSLDTLFPKINLEAVILMKYWCTDAVPQETQCL